MKPNVLQYEPHIALFVDNNDPLLFYRAIIQFAKHRLHPKGRIYMEIHENLGKEIKELFESGQFKVEIRKDLQGKERMARAER
jgi:release factor glutamine methyltransferase